MGSRNKVFLASLVSVVMVLSFAIGWVPNATDSSVAGARAAAPAVAITADGATPAGDSLTLSVGESLSFSALGVDAAVDWSLATDGSAELVQAGGAVTVVALRPGESGLYLSSADGVALVNLTVAASEGAKALEGIQILAPADQSTVFVQAGATNVPYSVTSATNDPDDTGVVQYTLNNEAIGASSIPPYAVNIADITNFITGVGVTNTLVAAASTYVSYTANPANPVVTASATSNFSVVAGNFDEDLNGLPDDPFALNMNPGDSWVSTRGGTTRQIVIVPLVDNFAKAIDFEANGATATITNPLNASQVVTAFAPAGLLNEGETGYLVVVAADTLDDLLDDGSTGDITNFPGEGLVPGARFVDVSIIVSSDGGASFSEVAAPLADNVLIQMQGLATTAGDEVRAYSYGSTVTEPPVLLVGEGLGAAWSVVGTVVGDGVVTASTNSLSIFAPFQTPGAANIVSVVNTSLGSPFFGSAQARATGGDTLLISVDNVTPADTVTLSIDGTVVVPTASVATVGGTAYTVTAPAAAILASQATSRGVDVSIEVGIDQDIAAQALTYVGPTVNAIDPIGGPVGGGTAVSITGTGLSGTTTTIGGNALIGPTATATEITGTTPAGSAGPADVVVAYSNNYVGVLEGGFVYMPGAAEITVNPDSAFDDGGYTVAVNAILGTQFVDPASGVSNTVFFTEASGEPGDGADPASDIPAAQVTFVDDTRLDILTPAIEGLFKQSESTTILSLYATTSNYGQGGKQNGDEVSNFVPFVFVDADAAAYSITSIVPNVGPAEGGNTVQITGEFGELEDMETGPPVPNGQQLFFGQAFVGDVPVEVEFAPAQISADGSQLSVSLYLSRADNAISQHPAAMSFRVNWDPSVIAVPNPGAVVTHPLLGNWYGKSIAPSFANVGSGQLTFVVSGGTTFPPGSFDQVSTEVTTFDNQLPEIAPEAGSTQQNPFPLLTINFNVVGGAGASTALTLGDVTLADRDAVQLSDQGSLNTQVVVGGGGKQAVGLGLFNVAFGTQAATVLQAGQISPDGTDRIDVTAPAVDAAASAAAFEANMNFAVDVRVESVDFDPFASDGSETLFAVSRADSIYSSGGGYAYEPGSVRQITDMSPTAGWIFGAEEVTITGQGFTEGAEDDPVVTFEVVDDDSATVVLTAELLSVSDTEIVVMAPVLDANVSARTTPATVVVDFGGEDNSTEEAGTFTYVKWDVTTGSSAPRIYGGAPATGDVTTNSFFFSASAGFSSGAAGLVFDGAAELGKQQSTTNPITSEITPPSSTTGTLLIPPLPPATMGGKQTDRVFGILRVTQEEELFGIGPLPDNAGPADLPFPGNKFETIFNFDLHLYEGEAPFDEFYVKYDVEDLPSVPTLVYNVPASVGLTRAEISTGRVATWSRPTTFDFEFATRTSTVPGVTAGGKDERLAAPRPNTYSLEAVLITEDTLPATTAQQPTAVRARIFNLGAGAFALRRDAAPRPQDISASTENGQDQVVTVGGGDEVVITGRNIYWATNLFAVPTGSAAAQTNPFGAPVVRSTTATGLERLVFISPPMEVGTYDLYLQVPVTSAKQQALILVSPGRLIVEDEDDIIPGPFFPPFLLAVLPVLLGGLLALFGLLAGGDSGSSGGPCFIATAAYGTPMATEIEVLRTIRDSYMLSNPLGAAFVDVYYRMSPALADVVAQSPVLAAVIRLLLTPVLFAGKLVVAMPAVSFGIMSFGLALAMLRRRLSRGM